MPSTPASRIFAVFVVLLGGFDIAGVDTPDGNEARERLAFAMSPVGLTMRLTERAMLSP